MDEENTSAAAGSTSQGVAEDSSSSPAAAAATESSPASVTEVETSNIGATETETTPAQGAAEEDTAAGATVEEAPEAEEAAEVSAVSAVVDVSADAVADAVAEQVVAAPAVSEVVKPASPPPAPSALRPTSTPISPGPVSPALSPLSSPVRSTESHDNPFLADGELCKKADTIIRHSTISRTQLKVYDPDTTQPEEEAQPVEEVLQPKSAVSNQAAPPRPQDVNVKQNGNVEDALTPQSVEVEVGKANASQPEAQKAEEVKVEKDKKCACCVLQ